jgi:hypothetical protein
MARDERTGAYARNVSQEDWDLAHKLSQRDGFGFGVKQVDEATKNAQRIAKDHMYVWNRLVENKGPIGMKKDEQQWEPRVQDLMSNEGFQTFMKAPTIQAKMVALRDVGIYQGMDMSDEELARFLMTHASSGLTEDPNVHKEAKQKEEGRTLGSYAKQTALTLGGGAVGMALGGTTGFAMGAAAGALYGSDKKELDKPIWKREDKSIF